MVELYGINDRGEIVGLFNDGNRNHSFVYSDGVYTIINDPLATVGTAVSGNDAGQIVGYYTDQSGTFGFLATPLAQTPLPSALPLFATGLGALGLLGWRRKRKALAA